MLCVYVQGLIVHAHSFVYVSPCIIRVLCSAGCAVAVQHVAKVIRKRLLTSATLPKRHHRIRLGQYLAIDNELALLDAIHHCFVLVAQVYSIHSYNHQLLPCCVLSNHGHLLELYLHRHVTYFQGWQCGSIHHTVSIACPSNYMHTKPTSKQGIMLVLVHVKCTKVLASCMM